MKNKLFSILAVCCLLFLASCQNGAYKSNSTSNQNNSNNPLTTLDSAGFSWGSSYVFSASIDGQSFNTDSTHAYYTFDSGYNNVNVVVGQQGFFIRVLNAYSNNIYPMAGTVYVSGLNAGYNISPNYGIYMDSIYNPTYQYFSYFGNVGQVQIVRNDAYRFMGRFYFQALNKPGGVLKNITVGYFNLPK